MADPVSNHLVSGTVRDRSGNLLVGSTATLSHPLITPVLIATVASDGKYIFNLGSLDEEWTVGQEITIFSSTQFKGRKSTTVLISSGNSQTVNLTMEETSDLRFGTNARSQYPLQFNLITTYDGEKVTRDNPLPTALPEITPTNPLSVTDRGVQSNLNTSTTLLGSGDTFTGTFEQNGYNQVGVSCHSNIAGTLFFDFSPDGVNVNNFPVNGFAVAAGVHEFHTAVKLGRFYRTRFVMDSGTQTFFRLYTYYGDDFLPSNAPLSQSLGSDHDAITVRVGSDHKLDLKRGFVGGQTAVHKFGGNADIAASSTEDIVFGGTINWLTAATTVRVKSGGNAADDDGGNGAQTIRVEGLDENFAEAQEDITLAGADASDVTTITFIRVYRAYVLVPFCCQ